MKLKRLFALITALVLMVGAALPAALAVEDDTKLETIRVLGIMVGDENGDLSLSSPVTRAEFVKMMVAASVYKDSVGDSAASLFTDVKSGHWASGYIQVAVEQGWFVGYVDGSFRPSSVITLEEACTALLRLLGYDSSTLTGSYPSAQLSKASAVGLRDDLSAVQGETLTRQECVTLFYNLLVAENSSGTVYGTTLGYTVSNGEVDYSSLVSGTTKGPYVSTDGTVSLPFTTENITVYRNGTLSTLSTLKQYDVYYYSENLRTVWIYSDRVTGTLTAVSPSQAAPTSVTVAGTSYTIGTSSATYKLSSQGSFSSGDTVTLLLGMNSEVVDVISAVSSSAVYYGVVVSSAKAASSSTTSTSDTSSVQIVTQVACSDGTVRTFYSDGTTALRTGRMVMVTVGSETKVTSLSDRSLSGKVNSGGTTFAGYTFADDVEILDTDDAGGYVKVYTSRLAGHTLAADDVRYYTLNSNGEIDRLILNEATGDTFTYAYLTNASVNSSSASVSASYTYVSDGQSQTISSSASYSVSVGGVVLIYDDDGSLYRIRQLTSTSLTSLSELSAANNAKTYMLADDVQVYLKDGSKLYATTVNDILDGDYTLTGWYDDLGCSAGGRIRVIIAVADE